MVFRRLKLLKYLQQINLSPEDTLALIRRLETESCRAEDYEVLIRTVRAHMELSADLLAASPIPTVCPSVASPNLLLYQSLPSSIPCRHANVRRRKDDTCVGTTARSITE